MKTLSGSWTRWLLESMRMNFGGRSIDQGLEGIFRIRDLTKIRCGKRENDKFKDGIRDLIVPRDSGLAKNWARDAGFMFACILHGVKRKNLLRLLLESTAQKEKQSSPELWNSKCITNWIDKRVGPK